MGYVSIPCNFSCCQGAINQIVCAETSKHKTPFLMGQTGHRSAKQCNMGHGTIHVWFLVVTGQIQEKNYKSLESSHDHIFRK